VHGPNLNLLGKREQAHYGVQTLAEINERLGLLAKKEKLSLSSFQSNSESALIDRLHLAPQAETKIIVINPAGFTHTSIALRDALIAVAIPFIEVHLSNPYARETFRHRSLFRDLAKGCILGFGSLSYELGLLAAIHYLNAPSTISEAF
jgi:3-dehydroquinate dehydratase-2